MLSQTDYTRRRTAGALTFLSLAALTLYGCGKKAAAPERPSESGIASWYGHPYHGRKTASGETYDMEGKTAAHRTLAFGTVVQVTNTENSRQVEVRINDRGPFVAGRIIDLSHGAAQSLGITGTGKVRLEVVSAPPTRGLDSFAVQTGAYTDRAEADRARAALAAFGETRVVQREGDQTWRVLAGMEQSEDAANRLADRIRAAPGVTAADVFVVRLDPEN